MGCQKCCALFLGEYSCEILTDSELLLVITHIAVSSKQIEFFVAVTLFFDHVKYHRKLIVDRLISFYGYLCHDMVYNV